MADDRIYALVEYEDPYVQPLLVAALKSRLPPDLLVFIQNLSELPSPSSRLLQWRQYEQISFDHLIAHTTTSLANSYVIRKALIRKHYLSTTVQHWLSKRPDSLLGNHVKPSVAFELDYAEFLDDALAEAEAWELKESWERNASKADDEDKEWWILKPGMSDRGQGIRLFSSEEELQVIFEEWDPDDEDEDDEEVHHEGDRDESHPAKPEINGHSENNDIRTSHLRHFIAQPYIHPPLLLPSPHESAGCKFHIRTYVLAVGALKVYIYKPMLALFAAEPYISPSSTTSSSPNDNLNAHLTNTCLQTNNEIVREGSVHAFWSLPPSLPHLPSWQENVWQQIRTTISELFLAATRTMSVHFQPLPNAFEIFALDFLVDKEGTAWVLEVNAFPDFRQTGEELRGVVAGLMEGVVDVGVKPFFRLGAVGEGEGMVEVLDVDLGRR